MFNNIKTQVAIQSVLIVGLLIYIGWQEFADTRQGDVKLSNVDGAPSVTTAPKNLEGSPEVIMAPAGYKAFTVPIPQQVNFVGETIPLQEPDLRERLDREIHVNANWHSNTILMIKRAQRWLPTIERILEENGVPADFKYLPIIESGLVEYARSPADAVGFWQLLKGTAKDFGLEVNKEVDERYDPIKSTEAACKYLKKAHSKFGNWVNVAASYNIGMRGFERRLEEQRVDSYFDMLLNDETARYFFRLVAMKMILENPEAYGFYIDPKEGYYQPEFEVVTVTETIDDLVKFAHTHGVSYKILKRYNRWLRKPELTVKRNTYQILISQDPTEQYDPTSRVSD
ncbi:MAG: lytic transglycosylase domain-containing protein [Tunicatimonas sp.]|uniref:lytic transglycosylase domain-containing protein n=1 Tax=Tunicatimonas sp. TaxID=1940096 RepID=UPI003C7528BA